MPKIVHKPKNEQELKNFNLDIIYYPKNEDKNKFSINEDNTLDYGFSNKNYSSFGYITSTGEYIVDRQVQDYILTEEHNLKQLIKNKFQETNNKNIGFVCLDEYSDFMRTHFVNTLYTLLKYYYPEEKYNIIIFADGELEKEFIKSKKYNDELEKTLDEI